MVSKQIIVKDDNSINSSTTIKEQGKRDNFANSEVIVYKTYPIRWLVLAGTMLLVNFSHCVWLTFTPIQYKTAEWMGGEYAEHPDKLNIYGFISFPISFCFGVCGAYLFDRYGSYYPLMVGGWSLSLSAGLRVIAVYLDNSDTQHIMFIAAQALVGVSLAMLALSPTKIANVWFPPHERAFANSSITLMLAGGILLAYVIGPIILNAYGDDLDSAFQTLMWFYFVPSFLGALLITFSMNKSGLPKTPSSPTSFEKTMPFWLGIKHCLMNKNYLLLVCILSTGMGALSILMISLPLVLCPFGYSESYSNTIAITILIVPGMISAWLIATFVDRKGHLQGVMKTSTICTLLPLVGLIMFSTSVEEYGWLSASLVLLGIFMYPILPLGYELSVETTYPVGPATSAGLNWVVSSLVSFLMELMWAPLSTVGSLPTNVTNNCATHNTTSEDDTPSDYNYRYSMICIIGITVCLGLMFVFFFDCPFKRRDWVPGTKIPGVTEDSETSNNDENNFEKHTNETFQE